MPEQRSSPIHLHLTAEPAERVLVPGDPGRALRLAQGLMDKPLMLNHNRGLWGYSGSLRVGGGALSIQSTGMGGPSAAIVCHELIDVGATHLLRIGTCGALAAARDGLALGDIVVVGAALPEDGTSRMLGAGPGPVAPSPDVTAALRAALPEAPVVTAVTTDLFYDPDASRAPAWVKQGAAVIEMEAAAIFTVAAQRGAKAGALLIVTDLLEATGVQHARIDPEALLAAEVRLGEAAASAVLAAA